MFVPPPDWFDLITPRARRVLALANQEARRVDHEFIDTPHVLLGILKDGESETAAALRDVGFTLSQVRREVEAAGQPASHPLPQRLPQTQHAKQALSQAYVEAQRLSDSYVGTEHLALAAVEFPHPVIARVLSASEVTLERLRLALLTNRGAGGRCPSCGYQRRAASPFCKECCRWTGIGESP